MDVVDGTTNCQCRDFILTRYTAQICVKPLPHLML